MCYPQLTYTRLSALPKLAECYHQLPKLAECYHQHAPADKRNDGYTVCPTQLNAKLAKEATETNAIFSPLDLKTWYNNRFLIGLRQATEISEYRNGRLPERGPSLASMQGSPLSRVAGVH